MHENSEKIQNALYDSCLQWITLYRQGNPLQQHERRRVASAIVQLWFVQAEDEHAKGNTAFPNIKDYIPKDQWKNGNICYSPSFLRFVGAITKYIEQKNQRRNR